MKYEDLFDHQKKVLDTLRSGSILNGGLGSGKSITALAFFFYKICKSNIDFEHPYISVPLYIITTPKKRDTKEWESDIEKFGHNPSFLKVDSWNNIKKYQEIRDAFFIFDEQRVVGYGAWTKSFLKIAKNNKWILLTATPGDTYMDYMPVMIANGYYKHKTEFMNRHVVYKRGVEYPCIDHYVETDRLDKIIDHLLIKMDFQRNVTYNKKYIFCNYNKELLKELQKTKFNPDTEKPFQNVSEYCMYTRRIVNLDYSRCLKLLELFQIHKKVIVFYNFTSELIAIRNLCSKHNLTYSEWNGEKHESIPQNECWLYLVQYASGCEGWNCILTDTIIFYSLSHSYKMTKQAMGRIDRLNTPFKKLNYYFLTSKSWIDYNIMNCLNKKKDFNARKIDF